MQINYQESKSVIEAKLIMNLGMACRLALMPNLMKCPTVRQRVKELEAYLQCNTCTASFRINYVEYAGPLNDICCMRVNCANKIRIYRTQQQVMPEIHTSNRINDWRNRQLCMQGVNHG